MPRSKREWVCFAEFERFIGDTVKLVPCRVAATEQLGGRHAAGTLAGITQGEWIDVDALRDPLEALQRQVGSPRSVATMYARLKPRTSERARGEGRTPAMGGSFPDVETNK
jgi:hypothetical protein